ncbi:MAG: hypothetical protein L3J03_09740 [Desulfobacterales bacterium]|nr:hypothetical protein [Desulfobacterales bacterium]
MKNKRPFLPTDQRGSLLIVLIVTMSIMAVAGAAMLSLVASSTYSELAAGRQAAAYYLAESGGRYAIPQIMRDRDQAKADLDGHTYVPADNHQFTLEIDTSAADYTYLTATGTVNPGGWTEAQARITFRIPTPPPAQEITSTFGANIRGFIYAPYSNLNFVQDSVNTGTFVGDRIDIRNSTEIYGLGTPSGSHSGGCQGGGGQSGGGHQGGCHPGGGHPGGGHPGCHPGNDQPDYVIFAGSTDDNAITLQGAPTITGEIGTNGTVAGTTDYINVTDKDPDKHVGLTLPPPPDPPVYDPPNKIIDLSNVRLADSPVEITAGSYNCRNDKININAGATVNISGKAVLVCDSLFLASSAKLNVSDQLILVVSGATIGGDLEITGDVTMIVDTLTVSDAVINISNSGSLTVFTKDAVNFENCEVNFKSCQGKHCKGKYCKGHTAPELFTLYGTSIPPQAGPVIQYFPDQ